jgi:hypothetical protein
MPPTDSKSFRVRALMSQGVLSQDASAMNFISVSAATPEKDVGNRLYRAAPPVRRKNCLRLIRGYVGFMLFLSSKEHDYQMAIGF